MSENKILNYINGLELRQTKSEGRGLFAIKPIKKGSLLIVEKAIAAGIQEIKPNLKAQDVMIMLAEKFHNLCTLKNHTVYRLNHLFDGSPGEMCCPQVDDFINPKYKGFEIEDISLERLKKIFHYNSFCANLNNEYHIF